MVSRGGHRRHDPYQFAHAGRARLGRQPNRGSRRPPVVIDRVIGVYCTTVELDRDPLWH